MSYNIDMFQFHGPQIPSPIKIITLNLVFCIKLGLYELEIICKVHI